VRLDSGDLAYLSVQARALLDEAGFEDAVIVASNSLDEYVIQSLKEQGATIGVWGVGTKLSTAYDQPALGGVYKLSAVERDGVWEDKIKLSEQSIKISTPGRLQVRRFEVDGLYVCDMIFDERHPPEDTLTIVDPVDHTRRRRVTDTERQTHHDLLQPLFKQGKLVVEMDELSNVHVARQRALDQLNSFHGGVRRFVNPHQYPVGLELGLYNHKTRMILQARGFKHD
jgi:nicotinate phosphoribosyltransferase